VFFYADLAVRGHFDIIVFGEIGFVDFKPGFELVRILPERQAVNLSHGFAARTIDAG